MWLFNKPPKKILQEKYGFEPTGPWLTNLQQASVRFNSGGSGSFVSSDGLVMTNHHVGADALQKLSSKQRDYIATGFHARSPEEEIKCFDLELNVLVSIEDVTGRINAAVKPDASPAEAQKARRAAMNTLEKESADKTGLRVRRDHLVPRRALPPLLLQALHRRPPGLRAGDGDRLLRRRPGQLRVSPLRPRYLLLPRL